MRAMPPRDAAFDNLRTFLTLLVVAHHAALVHAPFARFDAAHPLTGAWIHDPDRWAGFDLFIAFNDTFFMPLMFAIAGVFAAPSQATRGPQAFFRSRLRRLGLPWALCALVLMPLAFYPSFLQAGGTGGPVAWLQQCFSVNAWPCGPAWFLAVLLAFDAVFALLAWCMPGGVRRLTAAGAAAARRPWMSVALFAAMTAAVHIAFRQRFGAEPWWGFGPLAVWAARLPVFAMFYAAGLALGAFGTGQGLLSPAGAFARDWRAVAAAGMCGFAALMLAKQQAWPGALIGLLHVIACVALSAACIGVFLAKASRGSQALGAWHRSAFGIYVVHFVFIVWTQYALSHVRLAAPIKAAIVLLVTLFASRAVVRAWHAASGRSTSARLT